MTRAPLAALTLALVGSWSASAAPKCPAVGDPAPPFSLLMADGSDGVSLRKALEKKVPVVLGFWAYHCVPCAKELPALQRLQKELGEKATFLLVHVGPDEAKMKAKLADLGVTLPSASDDTEKKREKYCANALPLTYLLDPAGKIAATYQGVEVGEFEKQLVAKLASMGVTK